MRTPQVMIDEVLLDANIAAMAAVMGKKAIGMRPHVKTHKIPQIARRQLAAGASGITVATIGEAEVFVDAGVDDVFVAYPLWLTGESAARLVALTGRARIAIGVDSVRGAVEAGALLGDSAPSIEALIELDSGHHRSGVRPGEAVDVARAVVDAGLRLRGVFTFPGHSYGPDAARSAAHDEACVLGAAAAMLADAGLPVAVRSGGSSPSALFADPDGLTEARPGVYVFGDAQQWELGRIGPGQIALTVLGTVISRHDGEHRRVVLDSGSKVLGADRPAWTSGFGRLLDHPDARITALSEHHATVVFPPEQPLPELGTRLRVVPNHVCQVLNLVDEVTVVREGEPVDRWPVAARGCNS
ncbi:MAG: alanine racemase [Gordonia sp. (in: high G+C Gram-positive bacteria)]